MPTPLRAGLVLLCLSSPALAQQISLNFGSGGANLTTFPFNQSDCNSNVSYTVTWTSSGLGSGNACGNTQIFVTNSQSCPDTPNTTGADGGTQDVVIGTIDINTIATEQLDALEYYRSAAETPPKYSGSATQCGILVLWTKRSP